MGSSGRLSFVIVTPASSRDSCAAHNSVREELIVQTTCNELLNTIRLGGSAEYTLLLVVSECAHAQSAVRNTASPEGGLRNWPIDSLGKRPG
jgi:hypothetical protein